MTEEEKEYYTASEAQTVLGLSKAMFHRKVNQGLIPKYTPPGRKQSMYPKDEINALARVIGEVFEWPDRYLFSRSTTAEQEQEMIIGIRCFGKEFITPLPERVAFQQKNEYTFWSLKVSGRVVGYISTFRFLPSFLDDLLTGRRIERDITASDVIPFRRLEPFDVYIDVMAMDPHVPIELRTWYAGVLVSRFADTVLNFLGNGYLIQNLYTVTATPEGDNLVNSVGFHLMEGKSIVPGRMAYVLPLDTTGIARLRHHSRRRVYRHGRTDD